jgi:hypothetical protein
MAQYKVPQDVEADDKLLGPFSFRQCVYLLIAGVLIAIAVALFSVFPLLTVLPIIPAFFFLVLALPLKKDQPMETYLAAIVSYYLKPHKRLWTPGQKESTIQITAPKIVEESRTRDITGEEATHRLSFLADIVDTEGQAIKNVGVNTQVSDEIVKEANSMSDMFETSHFVNLENTIAQDENKRHEEVMKEMREAIAQNEDITGTIKKRSDKDEDTERASAVKVGTGTVLSSTSTIGVKPDFESSVVVAPGAPIQTEPVEKSNQARKEPEEKAEKSLPKASIIELANNPDFSIATIAKEANRINGKEEGEVFISLH